MVTLSIVVPLAPEEMAWQGLVDSLCDGYEQASKEVELLFVTSTGAEVSSLPSSLPGITVHVVTSKQGRAEHMNAGAEAAKGTFIWFLHADSILCTSTLPSLFAATEKFPESLLFFDLQFLDEAGPFIRLNEWGVRFRSNRLKIPFGDQGLCIKKSLFKRLGGYPEGVVYGEDHLFVWKARQSGIEVKATGGTLFSSARKYRHNGWLKTTLIHQYLWIKQAMPEWRRLKSERKA